jgi:hypothetical protein
VRVINSRSDNPHDQQRISAGIVHERVFRDQLCRTDTVDHLAQGKVIRFCIRGSIALQ